MAPESDQSLDLPPPKLADSVRVGDTIAIPALGEHRPTPGLAVILESWPCADPERLIGSWAKIRAGEVDLEPQQIRDVRNHGSTISLFFEGVRKVDVPIGARVELSAR